MKSALLKNHAILKEWLRNQDDALAWSAATLIDSPERAYSLKHRISDVLDYLAEKAKQNAEAGQCYLLVLNAIDCLEVRK